MNTCKVFTIDIFNVHKKKKDKYVIIILATYTRIKQKRNFKIFIFLSGRILQKAI